MHMADIRVFTMVCHSVHGARYLPRMVTVRAKFVEQKIYHGQSKVLMQMTLNKHAKCQGGHQKELDSLQDCYWCTVARGMNKQH